MKVIDGVYINNVITTKAAANPVNNTAKLGHPTVNGSVN